MNIYYLSTTEGPSQLGISRLTQGAMGGTIRPHVF